ITVPAQPPQHADGAVASGVVDEPKVHVVEAVRSPSPVNAAEAPSLLSPLSKLSAARDGLLRTLHDSGVVEAAVQQSPALARALLQADALLQARANARAQAATGQSAGAGAAPTPTEGGKPQEHGAWSEWTRIAQGLVRSPSQGATSPPVSPRP